MQEPAELPWMPSPEALEQMGFVRQPGGKLVRQWSKARLTLTLPTPTANWVRGETMTAKHTIQHLQSDPIMAALIERHGPCKLRPHRLPPFQSPTQAIIHQQLSGQAAGTILKRFEALYGDSTFPTPAHVIKTPLETLRTAGLSRAKATYIHGLALMPFGN